MQPIKWTDRKFNFGYEPGYTPFFIERLRCTAARLDELTRNVSEEAASRGAGGDWSVKEHIGHLSDLEALHDGRIDDLLAGVAILRGADMTNKATYDAGHNNIPLATLLQRFRAVREEFINKVNENIERIGERQAVHPRLQQTVALPDLLFFVAEHDTHHLFRISSLV